MLCSTLRNEPLKPTNTRYDFGYVTWTTPSLMYTKTKSTPFATDGNEQTPCRQFTKGIDKNANDTNLQSTRLVILQLYVSQSNNYANLRAQLVCNTPDNYLFSSVPVNNENKNLNSCFSKEQIHTRPLNLTKRKLTQRLLQVAVYVLQFFSPISPIGKGLLYCVTNIYI